MAYASRSLNKAERNYSATELECLAVKWGVWKVRDYLEGYHFIILTDHQSLKWLDGIENPSGHQARWSMELSQWDYEIRYRRGVENTVADALSCQPLPVCEIKPSGAIGTSALCRRLPETPPITRSSAYATGDFIDTSCTSSTLTTPTRP